ncbi:transmembrane protein [Gracilibacillus halophilus YIM-C55.5]|uniref:Transmembrane protein n=1 Tax=Gracilibacillus halophilus YIM-C55.5 TaxID=1308866 RepID=N4WHE4_9BACI|nr:ABC transporter permease subunit [Gracilibacillus halophilus]ENH95597.1 transmembrane protein [Gracilibacillus halophilus YIM-C55.5]
MTQVLKREFIDAFKSVRSILILLFITYVSYQSAKFFDQNQDMINQFAEESGIGTGALYTAAIAFVVLIFGFLFVFAISHDLINREIEMKTIRLLVTKTSRIQIVLGKFLGVLLFWVVTISISFAIISLITGAWFLKDYVQTMIFLFYIISFVLFISTIISKTKLTMFIGIFLGIVLPIIGLIAVYSDKWYFIPFKYLLPYNYLEGSIVMTFIPLVIGVCFISISIMLLNRKDF